MLRSLTLLACLSVSAAYHDACVHAVHAAALQSGFSTYTDAFDKYAETTAQQLIKENPDAFVYGGYAYFIGRIMYTQSLTIPLTGLRLVDELSFSGSLSGGVWSVGLKFFWKL